MQEYCCGGGREGGWDRERERDQDCTMATNTVPQVISLMRVLKQ